MSNFKNKAKSFFGGEGFSSSVLATAVIALILAVNVIFYILTITLGLYITPAEKDLTLLSGSTDALFADPIEKGRKVKISFCYPEEELKTHSTGAFVYKTVKEFEKRYPDFIEVEYINIITRRNSKGELVDLSQYKTDMRGNETAIFKSSVIFESNTLSKRNYIVVTDLYTSAGFSGFYTLDSTGSITSYNGEEMVAAMVSWVLHDVHKTAYLTTTHSEQADPSFANLLSASGYYIDVINLKEKEIPEDAGLLIISNPRSDFERAAAGTAVRTEIERLRTYLDGGGSIYVTLDPYVKSLPVLESFLAEHGIAVSSTPNGSGRLCNIVKDTNNAITTDGFVLVADFAEGAAADAISDKVNDFTDGRVIIREVAALELSASARPLLLSSPSSVCEADGKTVNTDGSYPIAAYSTTSGGGNVIVIPSVYASVSSALVTNGYANKEFLFAVLEEICGAEGAPYGCNDILYDTETLENLTMGTARAYTALIIAVPTALAIVGGVLIIRRKNR